MTFSLIPEDLEKWHRHKEILRIDESRAVEAIAVYLRKICDQYSASGVLFGLSGGIDSAVLAALAIRSLGRDSVHVTYLFDRDSQRELGLRARMVADWLGLELETRSIEPVMWERGIYAPLAVRITSLSGPINRFLHRLYRWIVGETSFISSLRLGSAGASDQEFRSSAHRSTSRYVEAAINARHIYRRQVLESEAEAHHWLLIGAANRTEWSVGWFVKGGVDDLPIQPLKGLYKTQIRQLAAFLGVPDEVQTQAPSPDMVKGITDEFALGMSYSRIDVALDFLESGVSEKDVTEMGITEEEIDMVQEMKRLSSWKRAAAGLPPPVDGGPGGGFRIGCTRPH